MIDLTVNIEPRIRSFFNPHTWWVQESKLDGYEGTITIVQQNPPIGQTLLLEWRHIQGDTMKEVAEKQLTMLEALKADIDKMINKIKL